MKVLSPGPALLTLIITIILTSLSVSTLMVSAVWQNDTPLMCGHQPYDLAVGDVDNDGDSDIVAVNWFTNNITIYLWDTDSWLSPISVDVGQGPTSVTIADATNDDVNDIIITNGNDDTLTLLEWDGSSGWVENHGGDLPAVGPEPYSSSVFDFDSDGDRDILVACHGSGEVTVLSFNGGSWTRVDCNLTMAGSQDLVMDAGCRDLWVGKLYGEPDVEVVSVNENRNNISIAGYAGGWKTPTYLPVGQTPFALDVADIDGDSHLDLVVANRYDNNVSIYYRDAGSSCWKPEETLATGLEPTDVVAADADNDGDIDIVTTNFADDTISIIPREGSAWGARVSLNAINSPLAVVAEDVNGDDKNDIVAVNRDAAYISIFLWVDNSPPTALPIGIHTILEDTPSNNTFVDLWKYFDDAETSDSLLAFSIIRTPLPANVLTGTIVSDRYFNIGIGPSGGNVSGTFNFTLRCTDAGTKFTDAEIFVKVLPVNDPPVISSVGGHPIVAGQPLELSGGNAATEDHWFNISVAATDVDGDTLAFSCNYTHDGWDVIDPNNGNISFLPTNEDVGTIYMHINVSDGNGTHPGSDVADLILHVLNTNDPPQLTSIGTMEGDPQLPTFHAQEGILFSATFTASDDDTTDTLTFTDDTDLFDIGSDDGTVAFIPGNEQVGTHLFNISLSDTHSTVTREYRLIIEDRNERPSVPPILYPPDNSTFQPGVPVEFVSGPATDPDTIHGDVLTYSWSMGDGGTLIGPNGTYAYQDDGTFLVNLTVTDRGGLISWSTIRINIEAGGDLPSSEACLIEHDDASDDVSRFTRGSALLSVGADPSMDITSIRSRRDGTQLVVTLRLSGAADPGIAYSVFVITDRYLESEVTYGNLTNAPPGPDLPREKGYDHLLSATHQPSAGLDNAVVTGGTLVFRFDLRELTGITGFDIFGAAVRSGNDSVSFDTAGAVAHSPVATPVIPTSDGDGGTEGRPSWFWPVVIGLIVLLIGLVIFFIVSVVMSVMKKRKLSNEEDGYTPDEAATTPEPGTDTEELPAVPELPVIPMTPSPLQPEGVPGGTPAEESFPAPAPAPMIPLESDVPPDLLPPTPAAAGDGTREAIPELRPVEEEKGDIFDELFTPVGKDPMSGNTEAGKTGQNPPGERIEVECYNCQGAIVVDTDERPLMLTCPHCGTESMLE